MTDAAFQSYAFTTAISLIGALLLIVYNNVRSQAKDHQRALEMKASTVALEKAEDDFKAALDRQYSQFRGQVQQLTEKQDREIDWLKEEMQHIAAAVSDMRRENSANQTLIIQGLQNLTLAAQKGK